MRLRASASIRRLPLLLGSTAWVFITGRMLYGCTPPPPPPPPIDDLVNVDQYAIGCYAALEIDAANIKDQRGNSSHYECYAGTLLLAEWTVKGVAYPLNASQPTQPATKNAMWPDGKTPRMAGEFPPHCDTPSWLSQECYGESYVQKLDTGNPDVAAVLLCRHSKTLSHQRTDFDDIARIMHNRLNGSTCWFQALDPGQLNGKWVPPPHVPRPDAGRPFWATPSFTAGQKCNGCHDIGAWMHSPWIHKAVDKKGDTVVPANGSGPYTTPGAAFAKWPTRVSVVVGAPTDKTLAACTDCHRIPRAPAGDFEKGSWGRWINWVTGQGAPAHAFNGKKSLPQSLPGVTSSFGLNWKQSNWMPSDNDGAFPSDHAGLDQAAWGAGYAEHITKLLTCASPDGKSAEGCETVALGQLTPNGDPTHAAMIVQVNGSPGSTAEATIGQPWATLVVHASQGDEAVFSWKTGGVTSCITVATLPPGSRNDISTASNWTTGVGVIDSIRLDVPGDYLLSINCDGLGPSSGEYVDPPQVHAKVVVVVSDCGASGAGGTGVTGSDAGCPDGGPPDGGCIDANTPNKCLDASTIEIRAGGQLVQTNCYTSGVCGSHTPYGCTWLQLPPSGGPLATTASASRSWDRRGRDGRRRRVRLPCAERGHRAGGVGAGAAPAPVDAAPAPSGVAGLAAAPRPSPRRDAAEDAARLRGGSSRTSCRRTAGRRSRTGGRRRRRRSLETKRRRARTRRSRSAHRCRRGPPRRSRPPGWDSPCPGLRRS